MPGAGKSDLALRFLFLPAETLAARPLLVADDQVSLRREGGSVVASCPAPLAGRIEVRGAGIARISALAGRPGYRSSRIWTSPDQPRFPQSWQWETVLGLPIRRIVLNPFELSAPVALALQNMLEDPED
jgi:serine kinase of HPr protein (carbohydrate metabolism regulator)